MCGRSGFDIPFDEMDAGGGLDDLADLARLESESGIFKLLLHLTTAEEAPYTVSMSVITLFDAFTHKSPFLRALLQSDSATASSPRLISPD